MQNVRRLIDVTQGFTGEKIDSLPGVCKAWNRKLREDMRTAMQWTLILRTTAFLRKPLLMP